MFCCSTPAEAEQADQAKRLKVEADPMAAKVEAHSVAAKVEVHSTAAKVKQPDSSTVAISDALAKFFGSEEKEIPQTEAFKRIWEYIKLNQLEVDVSL